MSGGARVRSGPTPDPNALRRDRDGDQSSWRQLPDGQIDAPAPSWPLSRPTKREQTIWAEEWRRPQAVVWREMGIERQVAIYVRTLRRAEEPGAAAALTTLVRQFMDDLGISLDGMLRKRWRIGAMPAAQAASTSPNVRNDGSVRPSARTRFEVIDGEGEARSA